METAATLLNFARWWVYIGLAVAAAFLALGLDRLDDSARGSFVFRVLLIPGLALLWPLVLWRWALLETGTENPLNRHRPPRAWHGRIWTALSVLIPLFLLLSLIYGVEPVSDLAPIKLSEAQP